MSELILYETPQTKNRCYLAAQRCAPVGVLVHSTGAVNRELRRYVDAPDALGSNQYNNHWNDPKADKCMHAFIGLDKEKRVAVAHTLPYDVACWGCGRGAKGSYNYNPSAHIQFEICQGSNSDRAYYERAIEAAERYCAHLCRLFSFTADKIVSHREAALRGYASNHGDPDVWMKCFGDSMDAFRARVAKALGEDALPSLRQGDHGEAVRRMQTLLIARGHALDRYGADGKFGAETGAALRAFQSSRGLPPDGVCGADTWAALDRNASAYTVTLPGVPEDEARALCAKYPQGRMAAE